jgi:hypothetical protein
MKVIFLYIKSRSKKKKRFFFFNFIDIFILGNDIILNILLLPILGKKIESKIRNTYKIHFFHHFYNY